MVTAPADRSAVLSRHAAAGRDDPARAHRTILPSSQDILLLDEFARSVGTEEVAPSMSSSSAGTTASFSVSTASSGRIDIAESIVALLYQWLSAAPLTAPPSIRASRTALAVARPNCSVQEAVHLSVLTNSLAMILVCSRNTLGTSVGVYGADLVLSMHRLATDFASWTGNHAVREVILGNVMRTVRCIRPFLPYATEAMLDSLKIILAAPVSKDIRIATAIVYMEFLDAPAAGYRKCALAKLEDDSSAFISTISVAAIFADRSYRAAILQCFDKLVTQSRALRQKLAKRRCAMMAVLRLLDDPHRAVRKKVLSVVREILLDPVVSMTLLTDTSGNLELVLKTLEARLYDETSVSVECAIIRTLGAAYSVAAETDLSFLNKLVSLYQSSNDRVARAAADTYCKIVESSHVDTYMHLHVVHLLQHADPSIRSRALECMENLASYPRTSFFLLTETDALNKLVFIVENGNELATLRAMNTLRLWSRHACNRRHLNECRMFLDCIVGTLVEEESNVHPVLHMHAVRIIATLLASEDNVEYLLEYKQLLPWLVVHSGGSDSKYTVPEDLPGITMRVSKLMLESP